MTGSTPPARVTCSGGRPQRAYARALRTPGVASVLLTGLAVRVPWGAATVIVVLHVLDDLNRTYAMAGFVATTLGITTAMGSPWRGRLLERVGVRRTLGPSIATLTLAGAAIPWVGYWPLLALSALSGLFALPTLAVVRASLDAAVDDQLRPTVMALDAIAADGAFMLGPACGIAIASLFGDQVALTAFLVTYALAGAWMWWLQPSLAPAGGHEVEPTGQNPDPSPGGIALAVIVAMAFACALADSAGELSTVAAMKSWHHPELIGLVISGWAVGSILGGILFGLLPTRPPSSLLLAGLSGSLALTALARNGVSYALLLSLNGLFVAPTYAAISSDVMAVASPGRQAEALSWQSGAMVLGTALGTPAAGGVIDNSGWPVGLMMAAGVGLAALVPRTALGMRGTLHHAPAGINRRLRRKPYAMPFSRSGAGGPPQRRSRSTRP